MPSLHDLQARDLVPAVRVVHSGDVRGRVPRRSALRAGIEGSLSEGVRSHGLGRARYRGQPKTQLQATAIAGGHQFGSPLSDAATDGSWTLAPAQAPSVSFCSFAIALGGMMSG